LATDKKQIAILSVIETKSIMCFYKNRLSTRTMWLVFVSSLAVDDISAEPCRGVIFVAMG